MLVEDKASGAQLIQTLRAGNERGVPSPIARKPEADKFTRAVGVSSMVEAGQLFLPADAHWLADFKKEVIAFPSSRHDDQVDALLQLLEWARGYTRRSQSSCVGALLMWVDDSGIFRSSDEDFELFGYWANSPVLLDCSFLD